MTQSAEKSHRTESLRTESELEDDFNLASSKIASKEQIALE